MKHSKLTASNGDLAMGSPRMVESPAQSISSRIRAQVRAVWLLQRDLPVPDDLLVDARGRGKAPVPPREVLQYPLSLEDHLDRGLRTQREAAEEQGGSNGAHDCRRAARIPVARRRHTGAARRTSGERAEDA
eukprot:CAMPEP_0180176786 /NCGR_PEP_ID=MMETSP0986-20121125/37479_1 /TAXON_ID=697907 /ORGANISM="non described non described, Strain CCMP2293" /LENGTH=131 /DNA_ID=CAMNT_0022129433 /DNA_START=94 /DNA_END=485 /DNA_ORIENTATION=-